LIRTMHVSRLCIVTPVMSTLASIAPGIGATRTLIEGSKGWRDRTIAQEPPRGGELYSRQPARRCVISTLRRNERWLLG
jgi:hypothetical protein